MEEDIYQDPELSTEITGEKPSKKDIYQELKSDFNNNKSNKKSNYLIYILAILLIVCIYLFIHKDKPNKIHEVSKSIDYIQVDGEIVEVSDVKIIKIPQEVYDSIEIDPSIPQEIYNQIHIDRSREQYLLGDKKRVLLITRNGCPYARKFRRELDNIFSKNSSLNGTYIKDIKETGQTISFECFDTNCASIRLFENCGEGICIINPMVKEIVVDTSQNANQILPLLKSYNTRYYESLVN